MNALTQPMQKHLQGYDQFEITLDGVLPVMCLMSYVPAFNGGRDEPSHGASASCEYLILDGRDVTEYIKPSVLKHIESQYLEAIKTARTERKLGDAA